MKLNAKNKVMLGSLAAAAALVGTAAGVSAKMNVDREAVKDALESKSFSAFQEATKDSRIAGKISTQDQFDKLVQVHELRQAGNHEEARKIADELGLKKRKGNRNPEAREAVKNNDYAAFVAATEGKKIAQKITTQDQFSKLVEAHNLREEGKHEEARAIMEELGFDKRPGKHRGGDRHNTNN